MLNRRLLMAQVGAEPPGGGIVTDGLIFRLEGKNRGGKAGFWIDTISGIEFKLYGLTEKNDGIYFPGESNTYALATEQTGAFFSDKGTFQTAVDMPVAWVSPRRLFSPSGKSDGQFSVGAFGYNENAGLIWSNVRRHRYKLIQRGGKLTLSVNEETFWENKKQSLDRLSPDRWSGELSERICVGGSETWKPDGFYGLVHEIRIYNRILTEDEILQNQQYDIDTYFGGVTPE